MIAVILGLCTVAALTINRALQRALTKNERRNEMTTEQMKYAKEGRDYWQQYVTVNGYAFRPTEEGLKMLSRNLDLNVSYLRKCINAYLEA